MAHNNESNTNIVKRNNSTELAIEGSRNLLSLTNTILNSALIARKSSQSITDESWMQEIWAWADKFEIHDLQVPRDREKLLQLTSLDISSSDYHKLLVQNVNNLTNYQSLYLWGDDFSE